MISEVPITMRQTAMNNINNPNLLPPDAMKAVEEKRRREAMESERVRLETILSKVKADARRSVCQFPDLSDHTIFQMHWNLLWRIAEDLVLAPQRRKFVVDEHNKQIILFMMYYFNNCPLAEQVFPDKHYKLAKPLLIRGDKGVGKTFLMQLFSEYLRRTKNPNFFFNVSVTEMVNYYTINNNLNRYTYNDRSGTKEDNTFDGCRPSNVCLNDVGLQTQSFFGQDGKKLVAEFLHARYEIWTQWDKRGHLTTNLSVQALTKEFSDAYGRTVDRFKSYNVIEMTGASRR